MIFDFENIRIYFGFHMTGSNGLSWLGLDFKPWVRSKSGRKWTVASLDFKSNCIIQLTVILSFFSLVVDRKKTGLFGVFDLVYFFQI